MKKLIHLRIQKGFSLVELLVVIAIIAVLAGASYPAIIGVIKKAKITEGNKMAKDLVFAIEGFEQKYDYLPYPTGTAPSNVVVYDTSSGALLEVLMGMDTTINPNNTEFFTADTASNGVNGIEFDAAGVKPNSLVDPWGKHFIIAIDYTGEKKIDLSTEPEFDVYKENDGSATIVRATSAVVASPGPDGNFDDKDDVKSW